MLRFEIRDRDDPNHRRLFDVIIKDGNAYLEIKLGKARYTSRLEPIMAQINRATQNVKNSSAGSTPNLPAQNRPQ